MYISFPTAQRRSLACFLLTSTILSAFATPAFAQSETPYLPSIPDRITFDENRVYPLTGDLYVDDVPLSIGTGDDALTHSRTRIATSGWIINQQIWADTPGLGAINIHRGMSQTTFNHSGSSYATPDGTGETLTAITGGYLYTDPNGTKYTFITSPIDHGATWSYYGAANTGKVVAVVSNIARPDGYVMNFYYKELSFNTGGVSGSNLRLQSVTDNRGYQLKYTYAVNDSSLGSGPWNRLTGVAAINNAVDYCDPTADSCSGFTRSWPSLTMSTAFYGSTTIETVTDALGRVTTYTNGITNLSNYAVYSIKHPASSVDDVIVTYNTDTYGGYTNQIYSITNRGVTEGYSYMLLNDGRNETAVGQSDGTLKYYDYDTSNNLQIYTDNNHNQTYWQYDSSGRVSKVTLMEGNGASYVYDSRGNVTQTTYIPKAGSGLSNIVTTSGFDTSCVYVAKCNQPNWTKDPLGHETDYVYNTTTGLTTSVTLPASASGVRPQTRTTYTALQAYYKNAAGSIVASGLPITLPTGSSECRTTTSCTGTADERVTTTTYGTSGVANNLLPTQVVQAAGDASASATTLKSYDIFGNQTSSTDPNGYQTTYLYDAAQQKTETIQPDPDGAGPLKYRATVFAYSADGLPTSTSLGTANADGSGFVALRQELDTYDANDRKATHAIVVGGATISLTQYSYDSVGRLSCDTQRMNPATFSSLPASACTLGTAGSFGNDRIRQTSYDPGGRVTSQVTGLGTPEQRTEKTLTYNWNNTPHTLADGDGNLTTYIYDGFDHLIQTRYPTASNGSVSNTADYLGHSYDSYGRLSSTRQRSGETLTFTYDSMGRTLTKVVPAGGDSNINYAYDNFNHLISALGATSGTGVTYVYDALGRRTSESSYGHVLSYTYDAGGRRTKLTYPDGLYVNYDYDAAGEVTRLRENGVTSGIGVLASMSYDDWGRLTNVANGNSTSSSSGFGTDGRLSSLGHSISGANVNFTFGAYAPSNQVGTRSRDNDAYAFTGAYNVDRPYTVNGLNQLTASGSNALSYDTKGNLAGDSVNTYSYDAESRLTGIVGPNASSVAYDPLGRLRQTSDSISGVINYIYDGDNLVAEYDGSNNLLRRYVHGPGTDNPLLWYEGSGTTDRRWLHGDDHGSIIAVSNAAGSASGINSYNEFGIPGGANIGRFSYTGQIMLGNTGLFYYKNRVYSATLGRFLQTDPAGYDDGPNWYNYTHSDPVNRTDPSGLDDADPPGTIVVTGTPLSNPAPSSGGIGLQFSGGGGPQLDSSGKAMPLGPAGPGRGRKWKPFSKNGGIEGRCTDYAIRKNLLALLADGGAVAVTFAFPEAKIAQIVTSAGALVAPSLEGNGPAIANGTASTVSTGLAIESEKAGSKGAARAFDLLGKVTGVAAIGLDIAGMIEDYNKCMAGKAE